MALTTCRACGTALPANAHACPACGAAIAPVSYGEFRPAPPRPPEPRRPWWRTVGGWGSAAGWALIVGVLAFIAVAFVRGSAARGQRNVEEREMAQEEAHIRAVFVMMQDTLSNTTALDTTPRPLPTTDRAKRAWVISRMLVDRWVWERKVMQRHGVTRYTPPPVMGTTRYQGTARAYPEVGTYLEGRAAAIAEIQKTSAAWVAERTEALARESGLSASSIRELLPPGFGGRARDDARHVNAMLAIHRHYVRVDPRVRPSGEEMLSWQSEDDARRAHELAAEVNAAAALARQAAEERLAGEKAAFSRLIE
ncbi:MAG TPA: zinc ribbon domain-containing protein [Longimicrobium sp.]|nr:zinc ribbon domain-containing protein [Longimicrobium sp.]